MSRSGKVWKYEKYKSKHFQSWKHQKTVWKNYGYWPRTNKFLNLYFFRHFLFFFTSPVIYLAVAFIQCNLELREDTNQTVMFLSFFFLKGQTVVTWQGWDFNSQPSVQIFQKQPVWGFFCTIAAVNDIASHSCFLFSSFTSSQVL